MPDPAAALRQAEAALAAARSTPLSRRRAMLAVLLLDEVVDALARATAADQLALRAELSAASPALAAILAVAALRPDGARLEIGTIAVPIEQYGALDVADFMVSLYNGRTVQRILVTGAGAEPVEALPLLEAAFAALRQRMSVQI